MSIWDTESLNILFRDTYKITDPGLELWASGLAESKVWLVPGPGVIQAHS